MGTARIHDVTNEGNVRSMSGLRTTVNFITMCPKNMTETADSNLEVLLKSFHVGLAEINHGC